jgi:PAS domain S-box-containing protein
MKVTILRSNTLRKDKNRRIRFTLLILILTLSLHLLCPTSSFAIPNDILFAEMSSIITLMVDVTASTPEKTMLWIIIPLIAAIIMMLVWSRRARINYKSKKIRLNRESISGKESRISEKEEKQLIKTAVNGLGLSFFNWNIQTDDFEYDNNWLTISGYKEGDIEHSTKAWKEIINEEEFQLLKEKLINHLKSETDLLEYKFRIRHKNGEWRWIELSGRVTERSESGKAIKMVGFNRDITELKVVNNESNFVAEKENQAQKIDSIGIMAGGIAHDFNNIFGSIVGNTELAMMDVDKDKAAFSRLENILDVSTKATDLVNQMLSYSGQGTYIVKEYDVSYEVGAMLDSLRLSIPSDISIVSDLSSQIPNIKVDRTQFRNMLNNIVLNASEAVLDKHNGEIKVITGSIKLDMDFIKNSYGSENASPGMHNFLRVEDNGIGISEGDMPYIFDPFFSTKFTGRGMGLSAVIGIVKSHNALLTIDSEKEIGTSLTVYFPISLSKEKPEKSAHLEIIKSTKKQEAEVKHILIVDSDKDVLDTTKELLLKDGYPVFIAINGKEAFSLIMRNVNNIQTIFIENQLYDMTGVELLKQIRQTGILTPVYMSSRSIISFPDQDHKNIQLSGTISKPYKIKDLVEKILK